MNLTMTPFHQSCSASHYDLDIVPLSDTTIAFSQHPYSSFTKSPTTDSNPHRRNPTRAFSISDPTLHTQPLDDTLAVPSLRRSFDHSAPHLPFSDAVSLNVPDVEALRIPRTGSPSYSVVLPLPPVEGPAGEPKKLTAELGERFKMPEDNSIEIVLEPLQMGFIQTDPQSWTSYLHPEGARYFCDTEKRVYTDANLYDDDTLILINKSINHIYDFLDVNSVVLSPTADLVLDLVDNQVQYYFADHRSRTVFYLDKLKTSDFPSWYEVQGASSLSHFGHLIEAEYWWHVFLFPSSLTIREDIVNELRDVVIHGIGDAMSSPYSTMTYSNEDLYKLLSVTNSLKKNVGTSYGGSICMLSRFMWAFAHGRFLHWHGQPAARLTSALLFSAPDVHLRNLEKIWVDRLMYEHIWKQTIHKLFNEWQEFTLFSTVLLNANVAFLAIQTIDQADHPYRSPGQVSSYLSTIASIGSIILSLLLVRLHRTKEKESAQEAWEFLTARAHPQYGLEVLAIVYSLPYALLMWGVVGFLVAIAWMCMADANAATRALTGLAWLVITVLTGICVWMGWEFRPDDEAPRDDKKSVHLKRLKMFSFPCLRGSRRLSEDSAATAV
ncbi:hypothetical protein BDQ17DRAFT_1429153 [Cyathus striatus]|nr:hypothetical protein BDQ17DRAFT_1429153 [Cyathus striatus]